MRRDRHSPLEVTERQRSNAGCRAGTMEKGQKTIYEKQRTVGSGHRGMWPRCEEAGGLGACHIQLRGNTFQRDKGSKLGSHSNPCRRMK